MTTKPPNPFDDFPVDGTPEQFFDHAMSALVWLKPYLNEDDINHDMFVRVLNAYSKMLSPAPAQSEVPIDWTALVMRQQQIVTMFNKARDAIIATEALSQAQSHSQSQSKRASKPRKLDEESAKRAAKAYRDIKDGRASYGGVKDLAKRFGVTEATIRAAAKKHQPN